MPPCRIERLDEAKADVRRLDRASAMRLFDGILHYSRTGGGHVAPLHGDMAGSFRLRLGDYRVSFTLVPGRRNSNNSERRKLLPHS
jgi:mRNA-degrading endonuclease RelE of RelBE toxin-antitoxin system